MASKSDTIRMQGPKNAGGFNVGNETFKPDAKGVIEVGLEYVGHAQSHGYKALDPIPPTEEEKVKDPNTTRAGGQLQAAIEPGSDAKTADDAKLEDAKK